MVDDLKGLKIGFLASLPPQTGGVTSLVAGIAKYMADNGAEPHFIGYDIHRLSPELAKRNINLHNIDRIKFPNLPNKEDQLYDLQLASKLYEVNMKEGLDLVHAHYAFPFALSTYLAQQRSIMDGKGFPYIVTGHGTDIHTYGEHRDLNPMLKLSFEGADAVTYVGKGLLDKAQGPLDKGGLGIRKKGKVIGNFIDTEMFRPQETDLRNQLDIPNDGFVIGHVSNFAPIKQTEYFYKLAENLYSTGDLDKVYFIMGGSGERKNSLEKKLNGSVLKTHFRFLGELNTKETSEAYSAMDFSALVSKREGCPLVVLESWACGTPVIGTNVEGINSTIENGFTGFLFDQDQVSPDVFTDEISEADVDRFANIVKRLKKDRDLRFRMESIVVDYANSNHSIKAVMDQYSNLYRAVIERGGSYKSRPEFRGKSVLEEVQKI